MKSLYSQAFVDCWKAYGRKEDKPGAYEQWLREVTRVGDESDLRALILDALYWQAPPWAEEGWKFAPYFVRYLKRRRYEDERPAPREVPRATQSLVDVGRAWLARRNGGEGT